METHSSPLPSWCSFFHMNSELLLSPLRIPLFMVRHLCNKQRERHSFQCFTVHQGAAQHESCPKENVLKHFLK